MPASAIVAPFVEKTHVVGQALANVVKANAAALGLLVVRFGEINTVLKAPAPSDLLPCLLVLPEPSEVTPLGVSERQYVEESKFKLVYARRVTGGDNAAVLLGQGLDAVAAALGQDSRLSAVTWTGTGILIMSSLPTGADWRPEEAETIRGLEADTAVAALKWSVKWYTG